MTMQVRMIKDVAKEIKRYCPDALILIISNPLDVLTYFFQKETQFSRFKVIGVASSLDTSRFRYFISKKFNVPQSLVADALVLGEHGDSMVPIFSKTLVDGNPVSLALDCNQMDCITSQVRNYWKKLRHYKNRSQFGIAKNAYDVIAAIVCKTEMLLPASIVLEGEYGESDVAMGVPVKISQGRVSKICDMELAKSEKESLKISAQTIRDHIRSAADV